MVVALLWVAGCSPFHESLRTMAPVALKEPVMDFPAGNGRDKPVWRQASKVFIGDVVDGRFHGVGRCSDRGADGKWTPYEPCEYLNGFRIDEAWAKNVLDMQERADRDNTRYWKDRRQQEQWKEESQARRQAGYEARQEQRLERALSATAAAMGGDYSQAAAAGMMGASTLQMAQAGNEQSRAFQQQMQQAQATRNAEQNRIAQQQLLLMQRAEARSPVKTNVAANAATVAASAGTVQTTATATANMADQTAAGNATSTATGTTNHVTDTTSSLNLTAHYASSPSTTTEAAPHVPVWVHLWYYCYVSDQVFKGTDMVGYHVYHTPVLPVTYDSTIDADTGPRIEKGWEVHVRARGMKSASTCYLSEREGSEKVRSDGVKEILKTWPASTIEESSWQYHP